MVTSCFELSEAKTNCTQVCFFACNLFLLCFVTFVNIRTYKVVQSTRLDAILDPGWGPEFSTGGRPTSPPLAPALFFSPKCTKYRLAVWAQKLPISHRRQHYTANQIGDSCTLRPLGKFLQHTTQSARRGRRISTISSSHRDTRLFRT